MKEKYLLNGAVGCVVALTKGCADVIKGRAWGWRDDSRLSGGPDRIAKVLI